MKMVFLFGVIFVVRFQPMFIVRMLIVITLFYSYIIYRIIGTFWFRYVLLMVILRGVLVVFTYIVTLIPNESFEIYRLVVFTILIVLLIITWINYYNEDYRIITINLWITYIRVISLFLVGFLLSIMLLVVSLRYVNDGAFRVK